MNKAEKAFLRPAIKTVLQRYTECFVEDKEINRICDGGVYTTIVGVGDGCSLVSETRLVKISDICAGINNNKRRRK